MGSAIGEMLPLAIGIAISPTTITATVLMLLSNATSRTLGLLVGCVVGVGGAVALFSLLSTLLPAQDSDGPSPLAEVIIIAAGAFFLVLAGSQWRGRPATGEPAELPKWLTAADSLTPVKALLLGLLLSAVVPKNLLLALSAGVIVGEAALSGRQATIVILIFTVIATSTVAVPVVAHLVAPARMSGPLGQLREWLVHNNVAIMVVVLLVIGVVMIGNGIRRF
ncbi:MAG TPA: GAP family protein [Propionibacteriaceae bacterium]|nr:GAP family protein [Propionibacteriaceae bacterium]